MDLPEDAGDDNSQQEKRPQDSGLSSVSQGERLLVELEPCGASGGTEEEPPEVKSDHRRCILHFDIDCFYAQARRIYSCTDRQRSKLRGLSHSLLYL